MKRQRIAILAILAALTFTIAAFAQPPDDPPDPKDRPGREWGRPGRDRGPRGDLPEPPGPGMRGPAAGFPGCDVFPIDPELHRAAGELRPFWRNPRIKEEAKLTDDQIKKLDEAFDAARNKLIDQAADLAHKQIALQEAMRTDEPDLSKIDSAIDGLGKARIEAQKTVAAYHVNTHKVLTTEQREQLKKFREQEGARERPWMAGPERPMLRERWQNMPEERREAIRERMKERRESEKAKESRKEEKEERESTE